MVFTPLPILLLIKDELYAISWRGYEVCRIWENWCNHLDAIFKILFEAGSDPNSKDENGDTPLLMAARSSFSVGLRILRRDGGADFMAKYNRGNLPLHEGIGMINTSSDESMVELRRAYTDCNLTDLDFDDMEYFTDAFSRVLLEDEESESESGF
ncbi:unnamed protein product [Penicillium pancosmium]